MAEASFPNWIDGAEWDFVQLGGVFLPGVCTVSRFADGVDIDVQKRRRKEKARLRDNGIAPCAFVISVELTGAEWQAWCDVLPTIKPRRPGAVRTPLKIVHPLPNLHGVNDVYVREIEYEEPTARKGMRIHIKVGEWFEQEKDTAAQSKKSKDADASHRLDPNVAPSDDDTILGNSFRNTDNKIDTPIHLNP